MAPYNHPYIPTPQELAAALAVPAPVLVWVNTRSHVYHTPGSRWYGHTADGQYMNETDAIAAGNQRSKRGCAALADDRQAAPIAHSLHHRQQPPVWHDPGVDVGVVRVRTAMFSSPLQNSSVVGPLTPGDWAILETTVATDGWLPVIRLSSGRHGWARAERLNIHYTQHRNPRVDLTLGATGTDDPPALSVQNESGKDMYFHVQGTPEVFIQAHASRDMTVLPGAWAYNASSANTLPTFGNAAFVKGVRYRMKYHVVSHSSSVHSVVSPAERARMYILQGEVDTGEAELALLKTQMDNERGELDAEEVKLKASDDDVDAKRLALDHTDQSAIDAFNLLVDAANKQRGACHAAEDKLSVDVAGFNAKLDAMRTKKKQLQDLADTINARN